jgi:ankyrin repeat protein
MAKQEVRIMGEVQLMLPKFMEIRHRMHEPYKGYRAETAVQLWEDYVQTIPTAPEVPQTNLFDACYYGQLSVVLDMLEKKADANQCGGSFSTPCLVIAAQNGHVDVVHALLCNGADIHKPREGGATALHWAMQAGHLEIVQMLLAHKANVHAPNTDGATPLHVAVMFCGFTDVVQALLDHNAAVSAPLSDACAEYPGCTPLAIAVERGLTDVAQLLREHTAL